MRQVGHADSKMTMDVYAQLQQRVDRGHGEAFDALVRRARERLSGAAEELDTASNWSSNWSSGAETTPQNARHEPACSGETL
jgi:hypothetical protein